MRAEVTHVSTQRSVRRAQAGQSAIAEDDSLGACAGNPDDIALLVTTSGTTGTQRSDTGACGFTQRSRSPSGAKR